MPLLLGLLLAVLIVIAVALGAVVLLQRSEGGALGMGGGNGGFMTARGAGDLLTRITWILGGTLFALCLLLTVLQGRLHQGSSVVDRLKIDPLSADTLNQVRPSSAPARTAPGAPPPPAPTGFEAPAPQVNGAPVSGAASGFAAPPPAAASAPASAKTPAKPAKP